MGRDAIVGGANFNAKMNYSSKGIQSKSEMNRIGTSLNLMTGTNGIQIQRGKDGGIEVNGEQFPWDKLSFGFSIGKIVGTGSDRHIDNTYVTIGAGWVGYGNRSGFTNNSVTPATTGGIEYISVKETELQMNYIASNGYGNGIYLKWTFKPATGVDSGEIVNISYSLTTSEFPENTEEYVYIPLYDFLVEDDIAILDMIYNMGIIYIPNEVKGYVITDIEWDEDEHKLIGKQVQTVLQVIGEEEEFDILTAEPCPDEETSP